MGGLIYENGRLTAITSAAGPANYGEPGTPGATRWTGNIGVTVRKRHVEQIGAGKLEQIDEAHLILPYEIGTLVVRGDTLSYVDDEGAQQRTAGTIVPAKLTGRVRVDLENA